MPQIVSASTEPTQARTRHRFQPISRGCGRRREPGDLVHPFEIDDGGQHDPVMAPVAQSVFFVMNFHLIEKQQLVTQRGLIVLTMENHSTVGKSIQSLIWQIHVANEKGHHWKFNPDVRQITTDAGNFVLEDF